MIIVSYYTKSYQKILEKYLLPSLIGLGLPHYIDEVKDLGSWEKNTDYKPIFLKKMLDYHKKSDIAFIDVDAIVNKTPSLFWIMPKEYDIGVHFMDDKLYIPNGRNITLLSGTLFLRNNSKVRKLIDIWIENTKRIHPEQKALAKAIEVCSEIKVYKLSRRYCYITSVKGGTMKPIIPEKDPIISHYQMSREARKWKK